MDERAKTLFDLGRFDAAADRFGAVCRATIRMRVARQSG